MDPFPSETGGDYLFIYFVLQFGILFYFFSNFILFLNFT